MFLLYCNLIGQIENARFTYALTDPSGAFHIDPSTGWLIVADSSPLDREKSTSLILFVEAIEEKPSLNKSPQRPSVEIDIELTDANDNSPVFQPTNLFSFTVNADAGNGTIVGQVIIASVLDSYLRT